MISGNLLFSRFLVIVLLLLVITQYYFYIQLYVQLLDLRSRYELFQREFLDFYRIKATWSILEQGELVFLLERAISETMNISKMFNSMDVDNAVIDLFKWILLNNYYQYDPGILYVDVYMDIEMTYEYLQLPIETTLRRGGDCEDLSLITYGVLVNLGFKTWIISVKMYRVSHVFVIAWNNDKWFIIDPASNFLNGYTLVFVMRDSDRNILIPLHLVSPLFKKKLVENGVEVLWIYDFAKKTEWFSTYLVEDVELVYRPNISLKDMGLRELLLMWGHSLGVKPAVTLFSTFNVMSRGEYKRDLSFDQLVEYLRSVVSE